MRKQDTIKIVMRSDSTFNIYITCLRLNLTLRLLFKVKYLVKRNSHGVSCVPPFQRGCLLFSQKLLIFGKRWDSVKTHVSVGSHKVDPPTGLARKILSG